MLHFVRRVSLALGFVLYIYHSIAALSAAENDRRLIEEANEALALMEQTSVLDVAHRPQLRQILENRKRQISSLAVNQPDQVRGLTLSTNLQAKLRVVFDGLDQLVESAGEWTGELAFVVQDDFSANHSATRLTLSAGLERFEVIAPPSGVISGNLCAPKALVRGMRLGNTILDAAIQPLVDAAPSPGCTSLGPQKVAVILMAYPGLSLPSAFSTANIRNLFFGESASMAAWVREVSGGKAAVTGDVFGPMTSDIDYPSCTPDIYDLLKTAYRVSPNFSDLSGYNRIVFVTPSSAGCATIGTTNSGEGGQCGSLTLPNGTTTQASISQIATSSSAPLTGILPTLEHEISHSFGIPDHASGMAFSSQPLGFLTTSGFHDEYGDRFSTLGGYHCVSTTCTQGQLNPQHKIFLGWLDQNLDVQTIASTQTIQLQPYESRQPGPKALRVLRPGTNQWLWIEYRQPIGFDATLSVHDPNVFRGVLVRLVPGPGFENSRYTHILDFNPIASPANFEHAALLVGQMWADPYSPLSIKVEDANSSAIRLTIGFDNTCPVVAGLTADSTGHTVLVPVIAPTSCTWSVTNDAAWIKVGSGAAGMGAGTIALSLQQNKSSRGRRAVLSVGGTQLSVVQTPGSQMLSSTFGLADASANKAGNSFGGPEGFKIGVPFTSPITTAFDSAEIAVYVSGPVLPVTFAFALALMTDANGFPGATLETVPVSVTANNSQPQVVIVVSQLNAALRAGTRYWLVLTPTADSPKNYYVYWAESSIRALGPVAYAGGRNGSPTNPWGVNQSTQFLSFRVNGGGLPFSQLDAVASAATYQSDVISPGEIETLFGTGFGSGGLNFAAPGSNGLFPTTLDGTSVLFDGVPASLIYVSDKQLSCVAPFSLRRSVSHIQVLRNGALSSFFEIALGDSAPGLFTSNSSGTGQAAILNADGTVNSAANPAPRGSVIVLYGTGGGLLQNSVMDGSVVSGASLLTLPTMVSIGGMPAQILYAGAAPGLIAGVIQVNAVVPASLSSAAQVPVLLTIGASSSLSGVTVAVK